MGLRKCLRLALLAATLVAKFRLAESTLSFEGHSYESIPARFGLEWKPRARTYQAHLQFLQDRPRLCEGTGGLEGLIHPNDTLPVALLVERGNCTFEEKAWVAMQAYPTVSFLVVYDHTPEKSLVSMRETSSAEGIKLGMIFISFEAGMELRAFLSNQTEEEVDQGGFVVHLDGLDPMMYADSSLQHLQTWILIAMGGFFTFITVFGCLLVFVQIGVIPVNSAGQLMLTSEAIRRARRLLTRDEVARFQPGGDLNVRLQASESGEVLHTEETHPDDNKPPAEDIAATINSPFDPEEDQSCAVCLDELKTEAAAGDSEHQCSSTLCLPCGHNFHLDCIVPWLTERQANCPLCKFDLLEFMLHHDEKTSPKDGSKLSYTWWKRQARRLWGWSPIQSSDSHSQADSSSSTAAEDPNGADVTPL